MSSTADQIKRWKRQGNVSYSEGDYPEAVAAYTRCLTLTGPEDPEWSLVLASRSAVLSAIGYFEQSAADAERALNGPYPDALRFRLHLRRALCYKEIGQTSKAEAELQKTMEAIERFIPFIPEDQKEELRVNAEKSFYSPVNLKFPCVLIEYLAPPKIYSGEREIFSGFSPAVTAETDEYFGRKVIAVKDIEPGEVILVEEPEISNFKNDSEWTHCGHCFKLSFSLMPCEKCKKVFFCSDDCKTAALSAIHGRACSALSRFDTNLQATLNLSETIFLTFSRVIDFVSTFGIEKLGNFDSETDKSALGSLLNLCYHRVEQEESLKSVCASIIRHCFQVEDEELVAKLAELSYRILLINKANSYSIEEPVFHAKSGEFEMRNIAYGTYTMASLMNHSCDPNVVPTFHRKTMVVRALRPILEGEQIFNRYCNSFYNMPKDVRQSRLSAYSFECACEACSKDWPPAKLLPHEPKFPLGAKTRPLLDKFQTILSQSRSADGPGVNFELLAEDDTFKICTDLQNLYFEPQWQSRLDKMYRAVELLVYYHFCTKSRDFLVLSPNENYFLLNL
ncbi:SET and MYND domain-containing protein 4-like [Neocloeon triangulifer]|uniref:SET and MYND domain-containing protein 4-like n=1 Tax=Neocloeon triangulifer TaxID=2078957 RepID=UPI00286F0161|nr:SET and MYND domain-containing protein 4-like [Neocloeon triangulifer]